MSDLHDLCKLSSRPIGEEYLVQLKLYLRAGIPSTYTIEEAYEYMKTVEEEEKEKERENEEQKEEEEEEEKEEEEKDNTTHLQSTTTPLHIICQHIPKDVTRDEMSTIHEMVKVLFEYGAGWSFTDINNDTPGCILVKKGLKECPIYTEVMDAGVRAEVLLRKINDNIEFIEEESEEDIGNEGEENIENEGEENIENEGQKDTQNERSNDKTDNETTLDPAENQDAYLKSKLHYKDDALVTTNKDGVMMSWETELMKLGCESLFKGSRIEENEIDSEINILNIGFGMGIIDTLIADKNPTNHYICEPHPDVLQKLRDDGWFTKKNVTILEGRWQDQLPYLLSAGIFFNGIYYDTYSEHYLDMLELFDYIVGLLKPHGVFSFFNGLGADREIIYDVYKKLVEMDLNNYGLDVKFQNVPVPGSTLKLEDDKSVWDDIKRSYWNCPTYFHPEVTFIDY